MIFSKLKWNLVFYVGIIVILIIGVLSFFAYVFGVNGMKGIQNELIHQKLTSDINAAHHYSEQFFGDIVYSDNKLYDETGDRIGENHEFVDYVYEETGDVVTIFI